MSYNGSGTFQINTSGQPVVTGTSISSTVFNALTADLATGLSTAITKDGQTTTTARIPFALGINSTLVTDATNTTSGSIITAGGVGIAKALFVGTTANVAGAVTLGGVATFSAQPIFSSLTASSAVATDASKGLVSVTNTGTGNNVLATGPTISGPTISDGTANGVAYLNGSKVLTTGSALVFDGTNLGLGNAPYVWLSSFRSLDIGSTASFAYFNSGSYVYNNAYYNTSSNLVYKTTGYAQSYIQNSTGQHVWQTAASGTAGNAITFTQAMTLDASGNLLVGKTTTADTTVGAVMQSTGRIAGAMSASTDAQDTLTVYSTGASAYRFYIGMSGKIYATSTTISAISDIRFKENVRDLDAGLSEVMALKPRLYDWKEGKGADIKNARGFIAQEFETVFPDLIDTWKDPAPEGEEPYKSVRQDLIPVLVKAIQEQQALITQLQADVAALKGA